MEIIIDIPNWLYNEIMDCKEPHYLKSLGDAVRDGTPLTELMKELEKLKSDYQKLYVTAYTEGYADAKATFNERIRIR